jgi:acid phosphatase
VLHELFGLANVHEFNLAYNSSEENCAVEGMTLAGQVLTALNQTISLGGKSKLNIQFGAYTSFLSYFGHAGLSANTEFTGMPDYASSMAWELVTNASGTGIPPLSDISVRFMFHNGTSIVDSNKLPSFPIFGQSAVEIPWTQFVDQTNRFAILSQGQWRKSYGNNTGICVSSSYLSATTMSSGNLPKGALSLGDAGAIGTMVTLGVLAV